MRAYALFRGPALEHLATPCDPRDLHYQAETYERLSEVPTYSLDLHKRYAVLSGARRVVVSDAEADFVMDHTYPVAPGVLWDWLNDPMRRGQWMHGTRWSSVERPGGRSGRAAQLQSTFRGHAYNLPGPLERLAARVLCCRHDPLAYSERP